MQWSYKNQFSIFTLTLVSLRRFQYRCCYEEYNIESYNCMVFDIISSLMTVLLPDIEPFHTI
jgi:hypothetical protein